MEKEIKDWVINLDNLSIESIDKFVKEKISGKVTTTQLRKFYGSVKEIEIRYRLKPDSFRKIEVKLLLPAMAYAVGRAEDRNKPALKDLFKVLENGIGAINSLNEFKNFVKIFEAIVAYNKFYEEKK
jgi:CRISPR type III-A-associated protein Csm2